MAEGQTVHIFGIRHHGPGSARSLRKALDELEPDALLVEGPPDAEAVLPLLASPTMKPPVALLVYVPDEPQRAVYFPLAVFSPEWQALEYGLSRKISIRLMDLPQAHQLAAADREVPERGAAGDAPNSPDDTDAAAGPNLPDDSASPTLPEDSLAPQDSDTPPGPGEEDALAAVRRDPLRWLAEAAGYSDGERWWEQMVEHRQDGRDLFAAILEAMTALRQAWEESGLTPPDAEREARREAYMRQTIRTAHKDGFKRIAVVCGAWHAPALVDLKQSKEDKQMLAGIPRIKVQATWAPWTYSRLGYASGYGAGIESPGWYDHLWSTKDHVAARWMTKVARLLRAEDLDASSAHVIEAVRLAQTLAALRDRPAPGLSELNEATQSVLLFGSSTPLQLIHTKLIIGETLGEVPDDTPMAPIQQDLLKEQRRLKLHPDAAAKTQELDLRKPTDLDRSKLLHRLSLLGIPWGEPEQSIGGRGTFHEDWRLQWKPEYTVSVIEAGIWGHTVLDAAVNFARVAAEKAPDLAALTRLLERIRLADLPAAVARLMDRLEAEAALSSDTSMLMDALPPLVNVVRYGDVRGKDAGLVAHVLDGLVARICIGLPGACASLDDDAAAAMVTRVNGSHAAIGLLQNNEYLQQWYAVIRQLMDQRGIHGLLAGRCCRLLLDGSQLPPGEAARRMSLALSTASEPADAASWIEGLLQGSGLMLLHDEILWGVLDQWVANLRGETFQALLPLLRRTFSGFPAAERRQIGELARRGSSVLPSASAAPVDFDPERAARVIPTLALLLGTRVEPETEGANAQ